MNYSNGNIDLDFKKSCKVKKSKSNTIKYGEYLFTEKNDYIFTKINNKFGWVKTNLPISKDYKLYLKKFLISNHLNSFVEVRPFNDPNFCLVFGNQEQYILDLKYRKIKWTAGGYYESADINFKTNMLECGGDLSSKTYVFNKYGKLVKTLGFW